MSYIDTFKKLKLNEAALDASEERGDRYMFFSNLQQIQRQCEILMKLDEAEIEEILENGHDWAADHLSSATETIDQVFDFIMNETSNFDMMEMSTSGGAGGYETPNAFGSADDETVEMLGYKRVKKKVKESVNESKFKKLSTQLFLR